MRVLLIEDEAQTGRSVEMMLRALGHDCDWVEDGETGLALARSLSYDVILLDIMLPRMDGYQVLQGLQERKVSTPVIIQTGLVERNKAVKGLSLGVTDYLIKPYGKEEIAARIDAVLERARIRAAAPQGAAPEDAEQGTASEGGTGQGAASEGTASEEGAPPAAAHPERRDGERVAVVKSGRISYRAGTCTMDCIILNLSDRGAALQPEAANRLPETFRLEIHHGPSRQCQVRWRYRNKIGVRFLDG